MDSLKSVACHQPNFLPWLGYFAKIFHSDVFFFLDDVQFTQGTNKHNWTTRVRIMTSNGPTWLSVPVTRSGKGKQLISQLQISPENQKWFEKSLRTIEQTYKRAPYFSEVFPSLNAILSKGRLNLCEMNLAIIRSVANLLEISSELRLSSELGVRSSSNQRLIELTKAVGGKIYLSGDGAEDYQSHQDFEAAGIHLEKMRFSHPVYQQIHSKEFIPGLSIFDALCNVGIKETRNLLKNSRKTLLQDG